MRDAQHILLDAIAATAECRCPPTSCRVNVRENRPFAQPMSNSSQLR